MQRTEPRLPLALILQEWLCCSHDTTATAGNSQVSDFHSVAWPQVQAQALLEHGWHPWERVLLLTALAVGPLSNLQSAPDWMASQHQAPMEFSQ